MAIRRITFLADAHVAAIDVDAGTGMNARFQQSRTFVDVLFTTLTGPSTRASAPKVVHEVVATATVEARLRSTFVEIAFASFTRKAIFASASKIGTVGQCETSAVVQTR